MTRLKRVHELLEAYGADPGRWPPGERAEIQALLEASPEAAARRRTAAAIDALLDRAPRPAASRLEAEALARRITARPQERISAYRRMQDMIWPRAAGLAAAAIVGFVIGTIQMSDLGEPADSASPIDVADVAPW
jgi:hypothetical protein